MAHQGERCKDCYASGYSTAVEDLGPNRSMYVGLEHIIMHSNDTCDCGRSYGEIARTTIEAAAKGSKA